MVEVKPVSVRTLLEMGLLGQAQVICGEKGLDRDIHHVAVVGGPIVEQWVKEDELILTTGYAHKDNPDGIESMLRVLAKKRAGALVFKDGLYLPPTLTPGALAVGEECALPVIRVSRDIMWADVLESIYLLLLRDYLSTRNRCSLAKFLEHSPMVAFYRRVLAQGYYDDPSATIVRKHQAYSLFALRPKTREVAEKVVKSLQMALLEYGFDIVVLMAGDDVVAIWPEDRQVLTRELSQQRAGLLVSTLVGAGLQEALPLAAPTTSLCLAEIHDAFSHAQEALLPVLNRRDCTEIVWYPDFGLLELLLGSMTLPRVREFCLQRIGPLNLRRYFSA